MTVSVQPRRVAANVLRFCQKLLGEGDTALARARHEESPLRARQYREDGGKTSRCNRKDDPGYNDQTGTVACSRRQRQGTLLDTYVRSLLNLETASKKAEDVHDRIIGVAKTRQAQREARERAAAEKLPAGAGHCTACGDWMPGGDDRVKRIRNGLCPRHKDGLRRAIEKRGLTRAEYIDEVKASK